LDSIRVTKNKLPLSIKEKETITKYSSEYVKAKKLIQNHKYFTSLYSSKKNLHIQEILLLITFTCVLEKKSKNTSFINQIFLRDDFKTNQDQSQSYTLWTPIVQMFTNPLNSYPKIEYNTVNYYLDVKPLPNDLVIELYKILSPICDNPLFIELIPYILECFEYEDTHINVNNSIPLDTKKKTHGIYYTPDDVVSYIINNTVMKQIESLKSVNNSEIIPEYCLINNFKVIDTSCGTGVFLIKSIEKIIPEYRSLISSQTYKSSIRCPLALSIANNIYGVDKSEIAVLSCIFIIIITNIKMLIKSDFSPYQIYQLALLNIKCGDAITSTHTTIENSATEDTVIKMTCASRNESKEQILNNKISSLEVIKDAIPSFECYDRSSGFWFQYEFPEAFLLNNGFSCIVGNPPYAKASENNLLIEQTRSYVATENTISSNIYTYFVENMIRFSAKKSFSGLIIPLSIAYSTSKDFIALRKFIELDQASWRFAFFDRSPDSIFGDDVKTRASIVFRSASQEYDNSIKTTKLSRWNSTNRDSLFDSINFSKSINYSIQYGIPKIGSDLELEILSVMRTSRSKLGDSFKSVPKNKPLLSSNRNNCLYLSNTGYNWIPVFLEPPISWDKDGNEITSSSVWAVECKRNKYFLYSLLASTISYWFWIVHSDIFHVSKKFVDSLPYNPDSFCKEAVEELIELGKLLWDEVKQNKIYKYNAGKKIGNYTYVQSQKTINEINKIIIRELNLPSIFDISLKKWYHYMLSAGRHSFKYSEHLALDENDINMED
jgi:hypothetical protein